MSPKPASTPTRTNSRKSSTDKERIRRLEEDMDESDRVFADIRRSQDNTNRLLTGVLISFIAMLATVVLDLLVRLNSTEGAVEIISGFIKGG